MADVGKLIVKIANATLVPQGLVQKGKSRTFLDDRGWFTTVVEFQPHKSKHGAYLNVGANFHWFAKDHFSFDMGYRVTEFAEFATERQFVVNAQALVDTAWARCLELRGALAGLAEARSAIVPFAFSSDTLWGNYHRGVVSGLCGDGAAARGYFDALLADPWDAPWALELKAKTRELAALLDHDERFEAAVRDLVAQSRAAKGLPTKPWDW